MPLLLLLLLLPPSFFLLFFFLDVISDFQVCVWCWPRAREEKMREKACFVYCFLGRLLSLSFLPCFGRAYQLGGERGLCFIFAFLLLVLLKNSKWHLMPIQSCSLVCQNHEQNKWYSWSLELELAGHMTCPWLP